jgi:hypothetical protein
MGSNTTKEVHIGILYSYLILGLNLINYLYFQASTVHSVQQKQQNAAEILRAPPQK